MDPFIFELLQLVTGNLHKFVPSRGALYAMKRHMQRKMCRSHERLKMIKHDRCSGNRKMSAAGQGLAVTELLVMLGHLLGNSVDIQAVRVYVCKFSLGCFCFSNSNNVSGQTTCLVCFLA